MVRLFAAILILTLEVACSKDSDSGDKTVPGINLIAPANSATFNAGDNIRILGTITDDSKVAELHIHVYNNTTAALLIDIHRYPNAGTYQLDESIVASAGINYKIQIVAIDKSGKQAIETVFVSGH